MTNKTLQGPLAGIKVLEFGTLIAGPFAARLLAEFGADVIKVEAPAESNGKGGDPLRTWRKMHQGTSLWWYLQARNKRSITLNLKHSKGLEIARELALQADILVENFRPGQLEKWGLDYESLSRDNPGLIMLRISGYGQNGPYRDRPGFGAIGEAMGGMRYITGYPDRPPVRVGISIGDSLAGMHGVMGILMALHHRHQTGKGQVVDVALYEAVFNMMESVIPEYTNAQAIRERTGASLPGIVPSNTYTCRDGQHIVIGGNGDAIFKRLMNAIGRSDMAIDPRLASNDGRVPHTAAIDDAISTWCSQNLIEDVLTTLQNADVPASRIYNAADMLADAQFQARNMFEQHSMPDGTSLTLPTIVPKLSATPGTTQWIGPELGQHTAEILESLGYKTEEIEQLRKQGVA